MAWFKMIIFCFFGLLWTLPSGAENSGMLMQVSPQEAMMLQQMRENGGASGMMPGQNCFSGMLNSTSQSIENTLDAQESETNRLLGVSQQYTELEQRCSNDLANQRLQLDQARADHQERLMQLPAQIELEKIKYEEAMLALRQECESSSGAAFMEWKGMVSQGVITPERGGPMALFSRGENVNRFQKLFYDDCLGSENNIERANIMARKLNANIKVLQAGMDASAMKLAEQSKSLSFKQGQILENCMRAEDQLDYQAQLARNMASATNSASRTSNFLNFLNATQVCMGGPGNALPNDTTGASSSATN